MLGVEVVTAVAGEDDEDEREWGAWPIDRAEEVDLAHGAMLREELFSQGRSGTSVFA